ncbi:MAG TPA: hypothetical protein VH044_11535, partial [Polyangiaceae bacterium]|nr:hypothetical protein [Polyangiaceae bacterium]
MSGAAASSPSRSSRAWLLSAFVGLVGVVALAGANFASYASTRWTDRTLEVRKETQEWLATLLEADVAVRALVARDTPEARESYEHALAQEAVQATLVQGLVADNETEVVSVTLAGHEAQIFRDWLQAVGTLAEAGHRDEALARLVADTVESLRGAFR